jgi:SPP1 family predicted phage head-tail adaptor
MDIVDFNKRIRVYETRLTEDGLGGMTNTKQLLFYLWAYVVERGLKMEFLVDHPEYTRIIKMVVRKNKDITLDNQFYYNDKFYTPITIYHDKKYTYLHLNEGEN